MRKIFLLFGILTCCLTMPAFATGTVHHLRTLKKTDKGNGEKPGLAPIVINHPYVATNAGNNNIATVTWTITGETDAHHIDASSLTAYVITSATFASDNAPPYGNGDGDFSDYFTLSNLQVTGYNCNVTPRRPTVISITIDRLTLAQGGANINADISLHFQNMKFDDCSGNNATTADTAPTFTSDDPGQYGNIAIAQNFYKQCPAGTGTATFVTIPANYYTDATQAAANADAQAAAQSTANAAGTCPPDFTYPTNDFYIVGQTNNNLSPTNIGGAPTSTYTVSPALPAGISMAPSTGVITVAPTGTTPSTNYTVTATNAAGTCHFTLNITVSVQVSFAVSTTNGSTYFMVIVNGNNESGPREVSTTNPINVAGEGNSTTQTVVIQVTSGYMPTSATLYGPYFNANGVISGNNITFSNFNLTIPNYAYQLVFH